MYSDDGNKACFNSGLQTELEKDIFLIFSRNTNQNAIEQQQCIWYSNGFVDSYPERMEDFPFLPAIANYINDPADLVFNLSYDIEININHIVNDNINRLPDIFRDQPRLAITSLQGECGFLKERLRRNYKLAIPHWHNGKIQLLLPVQMASAEGADLVLVADRDDKIKTVLSKDIAYVNARLICQPSQSWLAP